MGVGYGQWYERGAASARVPSGRVVNRVVVVEGIGVFGVVSWVAGMVGVLTVVEREGRCVAVHCRCS